MRHADQEARTAIEHELDVNMLVEAAAGTGKTTSLVTRIASLIRNDRVRVESLAAITFTVKAAAQLRERVQEALEGALRAAEGEERERLARAIDSLDRAFIGTTHAFCARLLRERPVEAGLDPEFEELDDVAAFLRMEAFWSGWYEGQRLRGSEPLRIALDAGVKPQLLKSAFYRLVDYPDVEVVTTPCPRPDLRAAVDAVLAFLERCEPCFPDGTMREKQDSFEIMMRDLVRRRDASDLNETLQQLAFLDAGNHVRQRPTQKNWPNKAEAKAFGEQYSVIAETLVRPAVRRWREYVHCLVIDFLRPAVQQFEDQRLRDGALTFNDLLLRARDVLRNHPAVRRYFQRRFTQVLVDEFQDTDPVQAEVLFYLTGEDVEERDWRKLRPRAGSLFIVGDPKQSIYRFRRADITTYLTVKTLIEQSGGRVVQLQTNFRSAAAICSLVNQKFRLLFAQADVAAGRQAAHVELVAHEQTAAVHAGVYVLETPVGRQHEVAEAEARRIARWIREAVASGMYLWGDFLLISGVKRRLPFYARALEREGIRYEITGGDAFPASRDLLTAMPLLRAVADPDDAVALAAFLRGPLCGVSDDALYRFVKGGGRFSAFAKSEAPPEIETGLAIVREGIALARELPPGAAMAAIFERAGIVTHAAAEDQGGTRAGNALFALALARAQSATGAGFGDIVAYLQDILDSKPKLEELDVDPAAANVVRLMNLHQAKGLEAPVVFLIDPIEEPNRDPDTYVDRSGEISRGYLAIQEQRAFKPEVIARPADWDALAQTEKEFLRAERMRLLYVAATRAKSMLVIGVTLKNGMRSGLWRALSGDVPALFEHGPVATAAGPASVSSMPPEKARLVIEARLEAARDASYSVMPITKVAHDTHVKLVRAEEGLGKGTSWGRVLHRLFEALVRNESLDVRAFAENLLKDEERDPVEVEEVVNAVDAVRASPLWSRLCSADERYVEIPFALMVPRREAGLDEEGETLLHGVIDLVFREGETWYVVDYKSDSTLGRLESLVAYYRPQVAHYARFWSRLTGAETRAALFFVEGCRYVEVPVTMDVVDQVD